MLLGATALAAGAAGAAFYYWCSSAKNGNDLNKALVARELRASQDPRARVCRFKDIVSRRKFNWNIKTMILFHQTNEVAARAISEEGFMTGTSGMLGAGVYFATIKAATYLKAKDKGRVLSCRVYLGDIYLTKKPRTDFNQYWINSRGFDSVQIKTRTGTEVCIYDADQIDNAYLVCVIEICSNVSTGRETQYCKLHECAVEGCYLQCKDPWNRCAAHMKFYQRCCIIC